MDFKPEAHRLSGKVALITGGGGTNSIGRSIALRFALEGARVGVLDIDESGAAAVAGEIDRGRRGSPAHHLRHHRSGQVPRGRQAPGRHLRRTHRYPGEQRRGLPRSAVQAGLPRVQRVDRQGLGLPHGRQPARHVVLRPGRLPVHAAVRLRQDHQHDLHDLLGGRAGIHPLCVQQGRHHRLHQGAGPRIGAGGHPGERHSPGIHPDRGQHGAGRRGAEHWDEVSKASASPSDTSRPTTSPAPRSTWPRPTATS